MAKDWAPFVTAPTRSLHAKVDEMIPLRIGDEQRNYFIDVKFLDSLIFEKGNHMGIYSDESYWKGISDFIAKVLD